MRTKHIWTLLAAIAISCGPTPAPKPPTPPVPPAPPVAENFCVAPNVHADTVTGSPIVGAHVLVAGAQGDTNQDGYLYLYPVAAGPTTIHVTADGFEPTDVPYTVESLTCDIGIALTSVWPQPQARGPLRLEPNDPGTGDVCPHVAPSGFTFPDGPDRHFWRGDAWGVTLPGAPFVAGGSSRHPERILSWFIDRYSMDWQSKILGQNRKNGYTHFTLSWPDSRDGAGQSAQQFAATAVRVHQAIPYIHVHLTSKDFDAFKASAATRMAEVSPAMDALIAAGFTKDTLIPGIGWELDAFNEGDQLEAFIGLFAAKYPGFDITVHFTSYKTSWQPDGQPRAQFWEFMHSVLRDGARPILLYQGNQNDPCGLMAAHFNDAQIPPSGIEAAGGILVAWELVAANEFEGDHPNEDEANARSWSVMMTPGRVLASGFGNGSRNPDGRPTLNAYQRVPVRQ